MVLKEAFDIENTYEPEPVNLLPGHNMKDEFKVNGHPAHFLHRLVPDIKYYENEETNMDGSGKKTFNFTAYVNGFPYSAQGEFRGFC